MKQLEYVGMLVNKEIASCRIESAQIENKSKVTYLFCQVSPLRKHFPDTNDERLIARIPQH